MSFRLPLVGLLIPTKVVANSHLKPVRDSGAMPVTFGAKRRW